MQKNVLCGLEGEKIVHQDVFPLELVTMFIGEEKITSDSENNILF